MKKKLTKAEQLKADWIAYNKKQTNSKLKMSFAEYSDWVNGTSRKRVKAIDKAPTYAIPAWATDHSKIKSLKGKGTHLASRNTVMERVQQGSIVGDAAKEIIKKSQRIGLLTSKGAYGYIGQDFSLKDLGKKTQQLED